jgi:16S rRNA (adenine1518-N6/adenine1519-N6)-dimethyltransferase
MKYVPGAQANNTKKSLGQHWLHDAASLEAIVLAGNVQVGDEVLEIGPGLGTLTDVLMQRGAQVTALEFDQDLIKKLEKKYSESEQVKIVEGDVRTFDFTKMSKNYKIVANIPYYLTSHLIRSISETSNPPEVAVLLIQKEVAQRLCARPGQMGILSVTAQFYFECGLDIEVPSELFTPPPKVDSQVVVLVKRKEKLFEVDALKYFNLVKAGFSEKRKTLNNSLSGGLHLSKEEVSKLLIKSDIKPTARAQELSLQDWYRLYLNQIDSKH